MLITVPEMIMSLQTLGVRRFTTGWKHTQGLYSTMVVQREPQGVTKVLESMSRMSCWSIWLWLIASHEKPFQILTQTTSHCCLSGIRTLWWSVSIPEDAPTTPKRIGLSSTNALITVSMRCYQKGPCQNGWRPFVSC